MKNTKNEELRLKVIQLVKTLLNDYETDIETGIEDGTYEAAENVDSRNFIKESKELIDAFEKSGNNISHLVEALDTVLARLATFTESDAWEDEDQDAFNIGTEALNRIS